VIFDLLEKMVPLCQSLIRGLSRNNGPDEYDEQGFRNTLCKSLSHRLSQNSCSEPRRQGFCNTIRQSIPCRLSLTNILVEPDEQCFDKIPNEIFVPPKRSAVSNAPHHQHEQLQCSTKMSRKLTASLTRISMLTASLTRISTASFDVETRNLTFDTGLRLSTAYSAANCGLILAMPPCEKKSA